VISIILLADRKFRLRNIPFTAFYEHTKVNNAILLQRIIPQSWRRQILYTEWRHCQCVYETFLHACILSRK